MSTYVFTYHGKLTWMPDHPRGFVKRGQGVLPPNVSEALRYRDRARNDEFQFSRETQQLLIEEAKCAAHHQQLQLHLVATEPTHVHILVSWTHEKRWETVRDSVKSSLTRALRQHFRKRGGDVNRDYFSRGSSRRCIVSQSHFDYWMREYGPSHAGLKWREDVGTFA